MGSSDGGDARQWDGIWQGCWKKDGTADTRLAIQRAETDFFSGEPLNALTTLVYSQNIDLQRSASLTFAEITERGWS